VVRSTPGKPGEEPQSLRTLLPGLTSILI
jgi:hypothetical protein